MQGQRVPRVQLLLHLSPQQLWDGEAKHHGSGVTDKPQEKQAALRGAQPAGLGSEEEVKQHQELGFEVLCLLTAPPRCIAGSGVESSFLPQHCQSWYQHGLRSNP